MILKEDTPARCCWKLAKVTELLKSKDNFVRAAKIQVLNTGSHGRPVILRRAIQHLIPLEVRASEGQLQTVNIVIRIVLSHYID